ncbi:MAG: PhnD/SsuA/transferrin family substrate-binding protein [Nitrospirae bacterium]|nr:PhnD/SsuA/transferrin family substrate-binding protein [Nitrospirota bacterium]
MKSFLKCSMLLVLLILCITAGAGYGYDIRIGVLANSGPEKCRKMWNPTARYLSEKLPKYKFTIVPLSFDKISTAVRNQEVDFLLANPFIYMDFEVKYGISHMATLKNKFSDDYPLFGGVIFTRSDNPGIYKLRDLAGKKFVAVAPASLGGWLAALRELKKGEIDPYKDFAGLQFTGDHDAAIYAVLEGKADAGTVNTNEFADLIRRGKIKPGDFRVIVPEWIGISKEFPYPVSTRLYPDWPFAKLRRTPEDLATKVAIALLRMDGKDEAARAANCYGWSYPLNYQSVDELRKELISVGYSGLEEMSVRDILYKYKMVFILAFIMFVILLIVFILLAHLYMRTKRSEGSLIESEKKLKDITSSLAEGIYVLDEQGNIIFMNPKAEHLLGWTFTELSGKKAHDIVHGRKADGSPLSLEECGIYNVIRAGIPFVSRNEVFTRKDGTIFPISVVASPIMENDKVVAAVTAFRDITERKQIEAEREKLIVELQEALAKVKQLSGLLPICASCKKIRDDKGYWNQIEIYISEHSEALFSHAICPECGKKLYPEYYDKIWGEEDK